MVLSVESLQYWHAYVCLCHGRSHGKLRLSKMRMHVCVSVWGWLVFLMVLVVGESWRQRWSNRVAKGVCLR